MRGAIPTRLPLHNVIKRLLPAAALFLGVDHVNFTMLPIVCRRDLGIDSAMAKKGVEWVGLYDYVHRAVTRIRVKDYTGALSDLDLQQKKYSKFAETFYYRGQALLALGRKEEARVAFEKAKTLFVSEVSFQ